MADVGWREHAGLRYLCATYTGATPEEALAVLEECALVVKASPEPVRMLVDVRDADLDRAWVSRAKVVSLTVFAPCGAQMAVVGVTQVMTMAIKGLHRLGQLRTLTAHESVDEALAALAAR